jgi:hypothetical protein
VLASLFPVDVQVAARRHIEELVDYAAAAGYAQFGKEPIDMTPIAYCSGALHALQCIGAISEDELHEAMNRCHDAYGLKRPPNARPGHLSAYNPEWADARPRWPRPPRPAS